MLRRIVAAAGAAVLILVVAVPMAFAAGPSRDFLAFDDPIDLGPGDSCAFPVRVAALVNKEYAETFTDAAGNLVRQVIGGRLVVRITNLASGASIVADISGPGVFRFGGDGTLTAMLRGNSLVFAPGVLKLTTGTVVVVSDATGAIVSIDHAGGTEKDLCAVLG